MLKMNLVDSVKVLDSAENYFRDGIEYLREGEHEKLVDEENSVAEFLESEPVDKAVYKIEEELLEAYEAADWT